MYVTALCLYYENTQVIQRMTCKITCASKEGKIYDKSVSAIAWNIVLSPKIVLGQIMEIFFKVYETICRVECQEVSEKSSCNLKIYQNTIVSELLKNLKPVNYFLFLWTGGRDILNTLITKWRTF